MSIVTEFMSEVPKTNSKFLKWSSFQQPLTVKFVSVTRIQADNPKFGDKQGMTYKYTLEDDGVEKEMTSTSVRLLRAVDASEVEAGDFAIMSVIGAGQDMQWNVTKLGAHAPTKGEDPNDMPF